MATSKPFETLSEIDLNSIVGGLTRDQYIKAKVAKYRAEHVDLCTENAMSPYRQHPAREVLASCMNTNGVAEAAGKAYDQIQGLD